MNILIFKTDIESAEDVRVIRDLFNTHPVISHWTIDTDDCDHVLRVIPNGLLTEEEVIQLVVKYGFCCELLPD